MKIKWKCLVGAFLGAIVILAFVTGIGYLGAWLFGDHIPPPQICLMLGLFISAVIFLPTVALYDLCKDKWH